MSLDQDRDPGGAEMLHLLQIDQDAPAGGLGESAGNACVQSHRAHRIEFTADSDRDDVSFDLCSQRQFV